MSLMSTSARAGIRAFNTLGTALRRAGVPLISLDADGLVEQARRRARLDDFGDEAFRGPLDILVRGYETEAHLTPLGRLVARGDALGLLVNRLRLEADRKRHPAIAEEAIRQPLFIVGLPRTGTTLLHGLLAQDPASRVARAWEVMMPSPPPEQGRDEDDPRIRAAERRLVGFDLIAPDFKTIHPLGARLPLECIAITAHTFLSPRFHTTYHIPSYQEWLEHQDLGPSYAFHRRFLQHLQWRSQARRWVLKAPAHVFHFEALFATYPDAIVVQTHRDPLTVLASVASLTLVLQRAFVESLDVADIGAEVRRRWTMGLERAMQFRRDHPAAAARFLDVGYHDLVRDPIAAVRRIYDRFAIPFTTEAEERMRGHLARFPKDKHGQHRYSLAQFGLDPDDLARRFKAYREHYGLDAEGEAS
jgi:hypothetical protein